jgi:AcrR family transcriptional regulator
MTKKKMTKRALQAEETKNKIVKATMEIMEKSGFNNMTIQEINERAGVSVGTFYHYFKTKEDVFYELYRKADNYFEEEVDRRLYAKDLTTRERIVYYVSLYAQFNHTPGLELSGLF